MTCSAGLTACAEHLVRYGGHSAAAGVELRARERWRPSPRRWTRTPSRRSARRIWSQRERVDARRRAASSSAWSWPRSSGAGAVWQGQPGRLADARGCLLRDVRPMGEGKHARFTVESGGVHARAVAFGNDGKLGVAEGEPVDATFSLEVNEWKGVSEPRLVLRHVQTSSSTSASRSLASSLRGARCLACSATSGLTQLAYEMSSTHDSALPSTPLAAVAAQS